MTPSKSVTGIVAGTEAVRLFIAMCHLKFKEVNIYPEAMGTNGRYLEYSILGDVADIYC